MKQLHESISIYNCSGVFEEFEKDFAVYHGREKGLLFNSGTSAIYSMFEGLSLGPGDEVICPTYTFFATVSPMMLTGAKPVFCDCCDNGNIDPDEIVKKITDKTKAVIVTHMWGIPCQMDVIQEICSQHDLALIEDCSHAHGASYKGKKVGGFGVAAAWSLQGQKIISGGEGGIMVTDSDEIYSRALLLGHYNKRCKQEIPKSFPLSIYSQTGFGQKFRAHPLAIAMAAQQFKHLDEWINQKSEYANQFVAELGSCQFLNMPSFRDSKPSWYAFVMQYDKDKANGVKVEKFVEALHAEGLSEVDIPGSTGPIHNLPLFVSPEQPFPRLYQKESSTTSAFPVAERFYNSAIKLPVWAFVQDAEVVMAYIKGFQKVIEVVNNEPELVT
ncbi:MAG: DegT/DnrJ/EryC1/StrS family aminotransferase [Patescibacteria group bacterium]|nr:DegT/DnrJ/EryC1/StrS family aminotransferase [Patescibacteria group bacterium]